MNFDETIEKVKKNGFCAIDNFLDENDLSLFLTSTKILFHQKVKILESSQSITKVYL